MRISGFSGGLIGLLALAAGCATAPVEPERVYVTDDAALRAELEAQVVANEALREENQMLRRELIAKKGVLPGDLLPETAVKPVEKPRATGADTGYWLSEKSRIRHNSRCRLYRKAKGAPCGRDDGRPCRTCGG